MENPADRAAAHGGMGGRLSDKAIKAFISKRVAGRKLADGRGLYLVLTSACSAIWRVKYRIGTSERTYTIGPYGIVGLAAARAEMVEVKRLLLRGKDPVAERRTSRAVEAAEGDSAFRTVADDWLTMRKKDWSATHYEKSRRALERDLYPLLGALSVASITPAIVARPIQAVHKRDALDTATRLLQHVNGIFRYAQAKGLCRDNPAAPVRELLPRKKESGRMPALLEWEALGDILRRGEVARLSPPVRVAHRLCAFSTARIGNVVSAEWREFDLDGEQPVWVIPRKKMKVATRETDHRIPLCREIATELRNWGGVSGAKGFVFPSPTGGEHIGRESIEKVYRVTLKLARIHSPHGWRSSFSTLARDSGFARDVVELALDHAHDNEVARAYDRGERFDQRVELFNWWGKQLAAAQSGVKVVTSKPQSA